MVSVLVFAALDAGGCTDRFGRRDVFAVLTTEDKRIGFTLVVLDGIDHDRVLAFEGTAEQFFAERIFDALFDRTTQRTSTVIEVAALLDQELFGVVGQTPDVKPRSSKSFADLGQFEIDDALRDLRCVR